MNKSVAVGAASTALLLALTACGNSGNDQAGTSTTSPAVTTSASTEAGAGEHNDADITFAEGMVPHHSQAIEMSDMLLAKQNIDPRVVDLAQQIKAAQGPEIEQLNTWLKEWGQAPASTSMSMPGGSMTTSMSMPGSSMPTTGMGMQPMEGMMSEQDMQALQQAQGVDASKLFLTQMIEHHKGAVAMAQTEVDTGRNPAAIQMAKTIITTQQQEIDTMEQILSTL